MTDPTPGAALRARLTALHDECFSASERVQEVRAVNLLVSVASELHEILAALPPEGRQPEAILAIRPRSVTSTDASNLTVDVNCHPPIVVKEYTVKPPEGRPPDTEALITRLLEVKEQALADAFSVDQEFGGSDTAGVVEAHGKNIADVIDEAVRRLRYGYQQATHAAASSAAEGRNQGAPSTHGGSYGQRPQEAAGGDAPRSQETPRVAEGRQEPEHEATCDFARVREPGLETPPRRCTCRRAEGRAPTETPPRMVCTCDMGDGEVASLSDRLVCPTHNSAPPETPERLRALMARWRERAGEKRPHGGFLSHSEAAIRAMRECADELEAALTPPAITIEPGYDIRGQRLEPPKDQG